MADIQIEKKLIELSEDERTTITNGLRVAAERFDKHVQELYDGFHEEPSRKIVYKRMAEQFDKQAKESRALAKRIDNMTAITVLEPQYACQNCDWTGTIDQLNEIPHKGYHERVQPGEPEPDGECPKCGALCHEFEPPTPTCCRKHQDLGYDDGGLCAGKAQER